MELSWKETFEYDGDKLSQFIYYDINDGVEEQDEKYVFAYDGNRVASVTNYDYSSGHGKPTGKRIMSMTIAETVPGYLKLIMMTEISITWRSHTKKKKAISGSWLRGPGMMCTVYRLFSRVTATRTVAVS